MQFVPLGQAQVQLYLQFIDLRKCVSKKYLIYIFFSRKLEQIKSLQQEMTECSMKLSTLEKERVKSLEDMAWAQNYCFGMDQKIKELENELSKYRPVLLDLPGGNNHLTIKNEVDSPSAENLN